MSDERPPEPGPPPHGERRRKADRRKGDRRATDRAQQNLTPKERAVTFVVLGLAFLGFTLVFYSLGIYIKDLGRPPIKEVNLANVVDPFTPLDNTAYQIQLCPRLMLEETTVNMRLFRTVRDFSRCEAKMAAHRRLDKLCEAGTAAMLEGDTWVKTDTCDQIGPHRSHWCEVRVLRGPAKGTSGVVPWECFKPPVAKTP